jgi:hypothetical protein
VWMRAPTSHYTCDMAKDDGSMVLSLSMWDDKLSSMTSFQKQLELARHQLR